MKTGEAEKATGLCKEKGMIHTCHAILGIDIGTTNICAVVIDIEQNKVSEVYAIANHSKLAADGDFSEFDACWITDHVKRMVDYLIQAYPNTKSIGVTGQMHGIVYVDEKGAAVSPFYNWQDGRANRKIRQDATYCEEIFARTGYTVFPGYGFATLFYNRYNGLEPKNAKSFCTIMDYITMTLAHSTVPFIHPSNAASFGLFDIQNNAFDTDAVKKLGLSPDLLPRIAQCGETVGYYNGIPVCVAIGDNQASFYGSVRWEAASTLVNFGTGSQISVIVNEPRTAAEGLELRPYVFGKYLLCGSALCGGKAYSILEKFFFAYAEAIAENPHTQYETMNALARKAYSGKNSLNVLTQFCGTRNNPSLRGAITDIADDNFTPGNLILGVLQGMVKELKQYFDCMGADHIADIVASGNAVQKNPVLQMLLQDIFGLPVVLTDSKEEAAIGAALYSGVSNKVIKKAQTEKIITYRDACKNEKAQTPVQ